MNVCYLFQDEYPWDVRAEKICQSLASARNEVWLLSRNRKGLPRSERLSDNLFVERLPFFKIKPINNLLNFPFFFSPVWFWVLLKLCRRLQIKILIVRDLPLAPLAIFVGAILRLRVVLDMAENYPAMLADTWTYGNFSALDKIVRNPVVWLAVEKWALPCFSHVLVVSRSSAERVGALGVSSEKITVVGNTPVLEKIGTVDENIEASTRGSSDFILLYVGGLEETRGLETVVRALPAIRKEKPQVRFVVAGRGTSEQYLLRLAEDMGVADSLILLGWVDPSQVPSVIAAADICLIPHFVTEHTQTTIPNKIYDYMGRGKPVLVSNAKSLVEIVTDYNCGLSFIGGDAEDLALKVLTLSDQELRCKMGMAGMRAVESECNWGRDERALYSALCGGGNE